MQPLTTGRLYDDYSFGNRYEKLFTEKSMKRSQEVIAEDLKLAGIYHRIQELTVLDVGSGRQALAFGLLGAKTVDHYDISEKHINRFKKILESGYPHLPITTTHFDLCQQSLPVRKYDFVYFGGVVHHFSNTQTGLVNGAEAVKIGGRIWVCFYRSGTFKWMICQMIRKLIKSEEIDLYFYSSALLYANGDLSNYNTLFIMDDFFNPYIHLFPPHEYMAFFTLAGFEICGTSHLDPISHINHEKNYHSGVIVFRRNTDKTLADIDFGRLLTPENSVDQLDENMYEDERIQKGVRMYKKFERMLKTNDDPAFRMNLCFSLHKVAAPQYYTVEQPPPVMKDIPPKIDELVEVLERSLEYLKQTNF